MKVRTVLSEKHFAELHIKTYLILADKTALLADTALSCIAVCTSVDCVTYS